MSKVKCPGQDTRYWKSDDIFSLPCGKCGKVVEFFKDDVSRICPGCGGRIQNPKITLGCAQWCEHAAECLGYDPSAILNEISGSGNEKSTVNKILDEISIKFGGHSGQYRNAEASLQKAIVMMKGEISDPKIVFPAVLVLDVDSVNFNHESGKRASLPVAREILKNAGIDNAATDEICSLVSDVINKENIESKEFAIVTECYKSLNITIIN